MASLVRQRGFLLHLAAEGMVPALPGCAGILTGDRAINLFGPAIVQRWLDWMRGQPRGLQLTALSELADLPVAKARQEVAALVAAFTPEDRAVAVAYLAAVPRAVQRALVLDPSSGAMTLPIGQTADDPRTLLNLLPADVPPYPSHTLLPDSPYRLGDLLASGAFAVYRATLPEQPGSTFTLKACRDDSLADLLRRERRNLDRLREAGRGDGSNHLVRLCDHNLDRARRFSFTSKPTAATCPHC